MKSLGFVQPIGSNWDLLRRTVTPLDWNINMEDR